VIEIDPELRDKVVLAVFQAEGLTAQGQSPALETDLASFLQRIASDYREPSQAVGLFQPARDLYRALGLDPTKTRPSSEALTRRVIQGKGIYRINRVVDTCNLCSIDISLSIGLYDSREVQWPVALRRGREGEGYKGLGKEHVHVAGRYALADAAGAFGNPSSDSFRTRIREATTAVTFVIFAPAAYPAARLDEHLQTCAARMVRYNGGAVTRQEVVR